MKTRFGLAAIASLLSIAPLLAQTAESIPFRMNLSPANEVPALTGLNASGFGTVWVHVIRDNSGRIISGTVDFGVRYQFPGEVTITGLHIHRGAAGTNGPVLLDTRITGGSPVVDPGGRGEILRPVPVLAGSPNVAVLEDLLRNPEGFYLNLHTTANPGGAIRAQMTRAERRVFGAMLLPQNEVPAVTTSQARGIGFLTVLAGLNSEGQLVSSEVTFDLTYSGFAEGTQFTGMHIHNGTNGTNGPVTIDTGLVRAQNILAGSGGAGTLKYTVDVNMGSQAAVNTVLGLWSDAGSAYWNLHTAANPGGEIRAQMRSTERRSFDINMSPANEVPAITNLDASATATFEANLLRRPDGTAMAALAVFSVNHRFPGSTTFTGLHIHTGAAGTNGSVTIDSGIRAANAVVSETGFGNIYRTAIASNDTQLASLNSILVNPDSPYRTLQTTTNPGGAVRNQIQALITAAPAVQTVISAISDPDLRRVAPGGLMTIFGTNLAELAGSLDGWQAGTVPTALNGTSVEVGGRPAAILNVDPQFILAQVPVDASIGDVDVVVKNANGSSPGVRVAVARVAPAVFFDQVTMAGNRAVAYATTNGSQITEGNAAAGGSSVIVFSTGLGISDPAQTTGSIATTATQRFSGVSVSVGGRAATNVSALLIPGYVGFSQIQFTVPGGLSGAQPLEVTYQSQTSNRTLLYVQ